MKFVKSIQIQLEDINFVSLLRSAIASLKVEIYFQSKEVWWFIFSVSDCASDCDLGQTICNKVEKSSKVGQDKKCLTSPFGYFLTVIAIV